MLDYKIKKKEKFEECKEKYPNFVVTKDMIDAIDNLNEEYTLAFSDVCKILKCSRNWVSKFVKPHIDYVYISRTSPLRFVGARDMWNCKSDSIYFSKKQFERLFNRGIRNVSRQAIFFPLELLVDSSQVDKITELCNETNVKLSQTESPVNKFLMKKGFYNHLINHYLIPQIDINNDIAYETDRKKCPRTTVELPADFSINNIQAVHDMKDYGDVDETIYRSLFKNSYYKFELCLPDKNGVSSQKIYYYAPHYKQEAALIHKVPHPVLKDFKFEIGISYECYLRLVEFYK